MQHSTAELLSEMEQWPWFQHVGESIDSDSIIPVSSWKMALDLAQGDIWDSVSLQAKNTYFSELFLLDWHRANGWNASLEEMNAIVDRILELKVRQVSIDLSLPDLFIHQVEWDILMSCMESEFIDIKDPLFYVGNLIEWYKRGHFPCGWNGPLIDGKWSEHYRAYKLFVF